MNCDLWHIFLFDLFPTRMMIRWFSESASHISLGVTLWWMDGWVAPTHICSSSHLFTALIWFLSNSNSSNSFLHLICEYWCLLYSSATTSKNNQTQQFFRLTNWNWTCCNFFFPFWYCQLLPLFACEFKHSWLVASRWRLARVKCCRQCLKIPKQDFIIILLWQHAVRATNYCY